MNAGSMNPSTGTTPRPVPCLARCFADDGDDLWFWSLEAGGVKGGRPSNRPIG
jgi:hypothetical protein